MQSHNPAFSVFERAAAQPDATAFVVGGRAIPYRRVVDLAAHFARRMQGLGIDRRATVGLAVKDAATATVATLAVALLGARWVPVSGTSAAVYPGATHVLGAGSAARLPGRVEIDKSWFDAPAARDLGQFPGPADPADTWMIAHSSGTTGKPKFMPLSYATLRRRMDNPELQDGRAPTTCNLFPATSYVGIKIGVGNLVLGGTNVAAGPWEDLLRFGVNRVMGSPAQLSASLFSRTAQPARRLRSCKVTGAQVTRQFVETALRYFEELHVLYGATEAGVATLLRLTDPEQFDGSAGLPYDGAEVAVVDAQHAPLAAGMEGVVRIRTAWTVPGYIGESAMTTAAFRDGWFYPGDLGFIDAGGSLHITGRVNDVLNAGGMKLNAADLDELIQLHPDVADGYCFMSRNAQGVDILSAMVTLRPGAGRAGLQSLAPLAAQKLGRSRSPRRIYVVDLLPRNENGKPLRDRAAELAVHLTPIESEAAPPRVCTQ